MSTITFSGLPLDFRLSDEDHEPVLMLDHGMEHPMELEIGNTSNDAIILRGPDADVATPDNHHFALRFRAGVLTADSDGRIGVSAAQAGEWTCTPARQPNGDVSLYLLRRGGGTLDPGQRLSISLDGLRGDRARGTRGTRVELSYSRLAYGSAPETELRGRRTHSLVLTTMRTHAPLPLGLDFIGPTGDLVLNDGTTANTVRVRLTNTSSQPLEIIPAHREKHTRFVVSFTVDDDETSQRALTTNSAAKDVQVTGTDRWTMEPLAAIQPPDDASPEWIVTSSLGDSRWIMPGNAIELELSNLRTKHANGSANLRITIYDLGGCPDGELVVVLRKSPLIVVGERVGIGTVDPKSRLDVFDPNPSRVDYQRAQQLMVGGRGTEYYFDGERRMIRIKEPLRVFLPDRVLEIPGSQQELDAMGGYACSLDASQQVLVARWDGERIEFQPVDLKSWVAGEWREWFLIAAAIDVPGLVGAKLGTGEFVPLA